MDLMVAVTLSQLVMLVLQGSGRRNGRQERRGWRTDCLGEQQELEGDNWRQNMDEIGEEKHNSKGDCRSSSDKDDNIEAGPMTGEGMRR